MPQKPRISDPRTWEQHKAVAAILVVAALIGAVGLISGTVGHGVSWIAHRDDDPYAQKVKHLTAIRLGMTQNSVKSLLGEPVIEQPLPREETKGHRAVEMGFRDGKNSWVQGVWYDNSLVLFTVEVCNRDMHPRFQVPNGKHMVLNRDTLSNISRSPVNPNYNVPGSQPPFVYEGTGTYRAAVATEAENGVLAYWGVGSSCDRVLNDLVSCDERRCTTLDGTSSVAGAQQVRRFRSETIVNSYGRRENGTGLLPLGLLPDLVAQFNR